MGGARQTGDTAKAQATDALKGARPKARQPPPSPNVGPQALMALQRGAGNAAMSALMAGRLRFPGKQAVADIDAALWEIRRDEPVVDTVEKGLKAAKAAGVPVDLEGVRPPPSALAVTTTGFGPGSVAAKKPVPPPRRFPPSARWVERLRRRRLQRAKPRAARSRRRRTCRWGSSRGPSSRSFDSGSAVAAARYRQVVYGPRTIRPSPRSQARSGPPVGRSAPTRRPHRRPRRRRTLPSPPAGDIGSQAKAAKADTMEAQKPGTFDKKAFITAVKAAIEAKSPKTLKEADDYKSSGKAGEVKGEVKGLVTEGKQGQAKDMEAATGGARPVQGGSEAGYADGPGAGGAGRADPGHRRRAKPAPPEQLNLDAGKQQANQEMADAEVSEPQLAQSNEPEFQQALDDKKAAAAHADSAPGEFRQQESQVIQQGKADAAEEDRRGHQWDAERQGRRAGQAGCRQGQGQDQGRSEARRGHDEDRGIFNATEADVKKILEGIDPKVEKEFNAGEADARAIFENYVAAKMSAYKKDRYGGWLGRFRWAKDKLFGMPDKVNEFYVAGRELYLKEMDKVISRVADIVGNDLTAAKTRIAAGRNEIAAYVKSLPRDLKKVGSRRRRRSSSGSLSSRARSIPSRSRWSTRWPRSMSRRARAWTTGSRAAGREQGPGRQGDRCHQGRDQHDPRARRDAQERARARSGAVGEIIKNPVGFLGNLIAGVKGGILKFKDNILDHLRKGLMSWLFGALAEGGIELPDTFDLKGIIELLASIFGLTWTNIRNRIVKQIGEKAMAAVEKGVEIFKVISGPGCWWPVADAAREARRHQRDDLREGEGLRQGQDHLSWH